MTKISAVIFVVLFFGFPFYWGAFGHPSVALPLVWGVVVAIATNIRRWQHLEKHWIATVFATALFCTVVSAGAFALGHMLSR